MTATTTTTKKKGTTLPMWAGWLSGGLASCTAEACTLPIDITKVRLQLQASSSPDQRKYRGMGHALLTIVREEGAASLWKGISPALFRQFLYSGFRMAIYEPIRDSVTVALRGGKTREAGAAADEKPSLLALMIAGGFAGGLSAAIFTPTDLLKIRMQASSGGPGGRHYSSNPLRAFATIAREEGLLRLWKGCAPTAQRAVVVAAAELATYDQFKYLLSHHVFSSSSGTEQHERKEGIYVHFVASFMAGFVATLASSPIDVVKTRIMNQPTHPQTGKGMYYKSSVDCVRQIIRSEGVAGFYKGFWPNWFRLGPWNVIMFITYEQFKALYFRLD
ncbi:Mitochondrial uncoupling protein 4 [Balamuthia mandrillaris]